MKQYIFLLGILGLSFVTNAQLGEKKYQFTKADTLRGSLNENRDWWNVLRYDVEVKPDYTSKEIQGKVVLKYKNLLDPKYLKDNFKNWNLKMQIDLQSPLVIDSVVQRYTIEGIADGVQKSNHFKKDVSEYLTFAQSGNVCIVEMPKSARSMVSDSLTIYYHGKPREALRPPWDGGWIWRKDAQGRPWMSAAVQGLGASAWFPCKDHQSDEPDNGASLTMIVPDTLIAVGNGRLISKSQISNSKLHSYTWEVKNPINSYNIIPYIGKYVNFTESYEGEKGKLDLSYWVLDYNLDKAKKQFEQVKPMLKAFEHWFGPYPFYEDGFKLVESPHLGMEHQSAVAYGNKYMNGYLGKDLSSTGWGLKWDFIIIHEAGHEWFANNITTKDIADMWVHEGFTNYSETLFTEYYYGKEAGNEYNYGIRRNIQNDIPIIGHYGVNKEGSGDMYPKAANMLHLIRHSINDDEKFRQILRGLNKTYWHQTVTTQQVEDYISQQSGINFKKVFDQYLRTVQIPQLEFYLDNKTNTVMARWTNSIEGFDLPLSINNKRFDITTKWNSFTLSNNDISSWDPASIEKLYYITVKQLQDKP